MNLLLAIAVRLGRAVGSIAIRLRAGTALAAALAEGLAATEPDVYRACTVDDEPMPAPRRIDTLAIWSTADQNSIDAAFLVIAELYHSHSATRRHTK
jgi:hypothetical protein